MSITAGTQLAGRYEIVRPLGAGGMGEVYRAKDLRLGRDVAVKVLPEHLATNSDALSRFEREARAVAALSHPNILAIHDFGSDNGFSFAVMELLEGETLRQRINASPLPWRKAVEIALSIAEGLSAAHSRGVTHRDLKPENIFLTSDGQTKILDFGLAQWKPTTLEQELSTAPTQSRVTQTGTVTGTVPYLSPEQVRGISVDARSDIFSFGSVLYEMLSGTRAFAGSTAADTMAAILKEEPRELDKLKKKIPTELERVISHCQEKNPELRFQTARDLAFDLKAILSGSGVVQTYARMSTPRIRPAIWITAVVLLLVVSASIYLFTQRNKAIRSLAVLPFLNGTNDPNTEYLSDGITESVINSLSQLPELTVMARGTVFTYKSHEVDPRKAGHDLNVEAVVTGRVVQKGDTLFVNADLVRVSDGAQLWGDQYERKLADVLAIEGDITKQIAENLRLRLTGDQRKLVTKQYTENPEAYRLYLRGMYEWWKGTEEGYDKAREYFQQAIEMDPAYALAYEGLGDYYSGAVFDGFLPPREAFPRAEAAYSKALQIDPNLALAHRGMGLHQLYARWNWAAAERELKIAIQLNPREPRNHRGYSHFLLAMNRINEALEQMKIAHELDPLSRVFSVNYGQYLMTAGKYDEAITQLQETIRVDPKYGVPHFSLAQVYEHKRMYPEAIAETREGYLLQGDDGAAEIFADAKDAAGYQSAKNIIATSTLDALNELAKDKYVSPIEFARFHAQLNEKDEAFRWLEKAFQERPAQIVFLKVVEDWDNLRSDPRFADLVKRIGLP